MKKKLLWALLAGLVMSGCSPAYVLRAGYEEARILWRREPIERVLAQPELAPATRAKLELVLDVRRFAHERLSLRVGDSYGSIAQVDADQAVHVVTGAYRLRLEPYTWWFPIVGRVPYKGYFSEPAARAEAAALEEQGYDANVRSSVAFSTLGWFADPLVSSLLRYDRVTLAEVIIHELLHNTTYLPGHADFDESFANFVGHRGAVAFFVQRGDEAAAHQAIAAWEDALRFSEFLASFTRRLREAYAAGINLGDRQRLFQAGQEELRSIPLQTNLYQEFSKQPLNNAVILGYLAYNDRLQLFESLYNQSDADLQRTITTVIEAVGDNTGDPFAAVEGRRLPGTPVPTPPTALERAASRLDRAEPANAVAN